MILSEKKSKNSRTIMLLTVFVPVLPAIYTRFFLNLTHISFTKTARIFYIPHFFIPFLSNHAWPGSNIFLVDGDNECAINALETVL